MKSKSSRLLPVFCALLVVALGLCAWLFLRPTPGPVAGVANAAETRAAAPSDVARTSAVAELPAHSAPAADPIPAQDPLERKAAKTPAELELADAIWIQGRVVYPEGTPIGEEVDVVANGRKFKTREMYRARVGPNGVFRIAFAAGTKTARVDLEATHLFLDESATVKLADPDRPAELLLEPELGGMLRGQLILPTSVADLRPQLVGKSVSSFGYSTDTMRPASRTAKIDERLSFELRGLPAELGHQLTFDSGLVAPLSVGDLRVKAGETLQRDFDLTPGVRLRGRVVDAGGDLPKTIGLELSWVEGKVESRHNRRDSFKVEKDGSFDLRGVAPGLITIKATGAQRLAASSELGELSDGDVREGIELVLQIGGRIAGQVLWPDETPVADARVQLQRHADPDAQPDASDDSFDDTVTVRTNAKGEFTVSGLATDPYSVLAQAKPIAESAPAKGKVQTWKATLPDVAPDKLDVRLVLLGGCSISGMVLDDLGAPVKRFRVRAEAAVDEARGMVEMPTAAGSSFVAEDGRFELNGLLEGSYAVEVSASQYDAAEPVTVLLPAQSSALTFVVKRRGSVSGLVLRPDGTIAPKAKVSVTQAGEHDWEENEGTAANAKGEFRIKSSPTGAIELRARLAGFAASEAWTAQLAPGQALDNVSLLLRVGGRITGDVLPTRPGEPIQGRVIQATIEGSYEDHEGTTDAAGQFAIEHLDPGEYNVVLEASADQIKALSGPDGGRDWNLHQELQKHLKAVVSDGVTTHLVFGSPAHARVTLAGVVRHGTKPVPAVRVRCQKIGGEQGGDVLFAITDAAGHYEFALEARSSYFVQVQPSGSQGTQIGRDVKLLEGSLQGFDFTLPDGRIAGLAVGPDGKALDWVQATLAFHSTADVPYGQILPNSSNDNEASNFDFRDLPAGTYTLELRGDIAAAHRRGRYDSEETGGYAQREIVLREGEEVAALRIELTRPGTLTVHVQLADGSSAGAGEIIVRRAKSVWPRTESFEDGSGEIDNLEAGVYEVCAQGEEQLSAAPTRVEVVAGQASEVSLSLRSGGHLELSALDGRGQGAAANVRVFDMDGRELAQVPIEANGTAGPLLPGRCRVLATDGAGHTVEAQAEVVAGETIEVKLVFP